VNALEVGSQSPTISPDPAGSGDGIGGKRERASTTEPASLFRKLSFISPTSKSI